MSTFLLILTLLSLCIWIAILATRFGAARFLYNAADAPDKLNGSLPHDAITHPYAGDPAAWPAVTAIVPGRNEGHILEATLGSLCALDYPNLRVVFIDDQSTDNTATVCETLRKTFPHLTVIHNTVSPPKGWVGKVWAVHQAKAHATTEYLLFADSDLHFHPAALKQMMRLALHRKTDLASALPCMIMKSPGELLGVLAGMLLITSAMPLRVCNNPRSKKALAAGGFSLYRRDAYEAIGRHEAVRSQVIEDIALTTRLKFAGKSAFTVMTHDLYTGRMYEGLRDTFRGLKKNAFAGAHYSYALAACYSFILLAAVIFLPLYVLAATWLWISQPSLLTFATCIASLAALWTMLAVGTRDAQLLRLPPAYAFLIPPAVAFFLLVFLSSVLDHARGGNSWSGRKMAAEDLGTLKKT
jgi:cellulose synthase/poly-beta-1,6-N-acetylglucosamine synthase-like glycosyltransferase